VDGLVDERGEGRKADVEVAQEVQQRRVHLRSTRRGRRLLRSTRHAGAAARRGFTQPFCPVRRPSPAQETARAARAEHTRTRTNHSTAQNSKPERGAHRDKVGVLLRGAAAAGCEREAPQHLASQHKASGTNHAGMRRSQAAGSRRSARSSTPHLPSPASAATTTAWRRRRKRAERREAAAAGAAHQREELRRKLFMVRRMCAGSVRRPLQRLLPARWRARSHGPPHQSHPHQSHPHQSQETHTSSQAGHGAGAGEAEGRGGRAVIALPVACESGHLRTQGTTRHGEAAVATSAEPLCALCGQPPPTRRASRFGARETRDRRTREAPVGRGLEGRHEHVDDLLPEPACGAARARGASRARVPKEDVRR
jgi:hypothetical protein